MKVKLFPILLAFFITASLMVRTAQVQPQKAASVPVISQATTPQQNIPQASAAPVQQSQPSKKEEVVEEEPAEEESPEEEPAEEEAAEEPAAAEKEAPDTKAVQEQPAEEATQETSQEEPAEEEATEESAAKEESSEEEPTEEEATEESEEEGTGEEETEEESAEEEESTLPKKFVTKWEDVGFQFDELEVAPLPKDVKKEEEEIKLPEATELDIDFEGLTQPEMEYVESKTEEQKLAQLSGLKLQIPVIGLITLDPVMVGEDYGYEFDSSKYGKTINAGILVIQKYKLRIVGPEVSFTGEGTILGKAGKLYLKHITTSGLVPSNSRLLGKDATVDASGTVGTVDQMVMSFVYDDKVQPKISIPSVGDLTLEGTDIVFQKDKPVLIIGTCRIFGVQSEVGLALTKRRVNAFINVQMKVDEKCKDPAFKNTPACTQQHLTFKDVIPQIAQANKSIGDSTIQDLIFKIHNLIVISPGKIVQKIANPTQQTMSTDLLRGTLSAIINLEGTDLATNPSQMITEVSAMRKLKDPTNQYKRSPLEAQLTMEFDKFGYEGRLSADVIYLKDVGKIESPVIETSIKRYMGTFEALIDISGDLVIPLQGEAPLRISPIIIRLVNEGITVSGSIPDFTYKGMQFNNLEVSIDTITKELILQGSKVFGDFEIQLVFKIIEPTVENCGKIKKECLREGSMLCKEQAKTHKLSPEVLQACEQETKDTCENEIDSCKEEKQLAKEEGTAPKREIEIKARLISSSYCNKQSYQCIQTKIADCKKTGPEKKKALDDKKAELKKKEAEAIAFTNDNNKEKADAAWAEYDKLLKDIGQDQDKLDNCFSYAYNQCRTEKSACDQKQMLAKRKTTDREDVNTVRAELASKADAATKTAYETAQVEQISFYPFKDLPGFPTELTSIKLTDIDVGIEFRRDETGTASGSIYFKALAHAFGTILPCDLRFVHNSAGQNGVVLTLPFLNRVSLEQLVPYALKGAPYNAIYVEKPKLVISTLDTPELRKGVIISGGVPLSGGLEDLGKLLGKQSMLFGLKGIINLNSIRMSQLEISLGKDTEGLTIQEKCKKETLDCIKRREEECNLDKTKTEAQKKECKDKFTKECKDKESGCLQESNQVVSMGDVAIIIGLEPSFGVRANVVIRPPMQKDKIIKANARIDLKPDQANITAYMEGTWYDAFTLKGWELGDVTFHIGQKYGSPVPTQLGGAGHIKIVGSSLAQVMNPAFNSVSKNKEYQASVTAMSDTLKTINLTMDGAFMADAGLKDMAVEFKTSKVITWPELLVTFCSSLFGSLDNNNPLLEKLLFLNTILPKITELEGHYAAHDVRIGAKIIPRGIGFGCQLELFGKKGRLKMHIKDDGIDGLATFEKIDTPYFKLTGAGEDKILGTADDAPIIRVVLNLMQQEFYMDGQVELILPQIGSIKSHTHVHIGFDEFWFLTEGNVFNLFAASLEAKIKPGNLKDIYVKGKLQHAGLTMLGDLLKKAAKELNKQAMKDIEAAKKEVAAALNENEIVAAQARSLDNAMKEVQQRLKELNGLKSRLDTAARACGH